MEYVRLQENEKNRKAPTKDQGYSLEEIIANGWNYGRRVERGFVYIDFDTQETANKMNEIIESLGLKCKRLTTDHGMQFLFKTDANKITDGSKGYNWIGIEGDIKGCGLKDTKKPGYQAIKVLGKQRVEAYMGGAKRDEELDLLPKWCYKASKNRQINLMDDMTGSRNDMFHGDFMIECKRNGFSYEEYFFIANLVNDYVLPEGLPKDELATAIRQEEWDKLEIGDDKLKIIDQANDVIEHFNCVICGGKLMFYLNEEGHYTSNDLLLNMYLQEKYSYENIRMSQIKEVRDQMDLQLYGHKRYSVNRNEEYVVCKDELVSVLKDETKPLSRTVVTDVIYPYKIMTNDEFYAYNGRMKVFLDDISTHDENKLKVILECLGCMLAPVSKFGKIFIWYGGGANGKSLLIKLMSLIMGDLMTHGNVLAINDKFALEGVMNGICNVTDDVGITTIRETGILKSIIDGSEIEVHRKYRSSVKWKPNSQFVMCCNEIPRINDTTKGMIRRLAFIQFDMQLKDDEIDVFLLDKLKADPDGLRYLMTAAIRAYRNAVARGHLTVLDKQKDLENDFIDENKDQITEFYEYLMNENHNDKNELMRWLNGKMTNEVYDDYVKWCSNFTSKVESQIGFTRKFKRKLPAEIGTRIQKLDGKTWSVYEIQLK